MLNIQKTFGYVANLGEQIRGKAQRTQKYVSIPKEDTSLKHAGTLRVFRSKLAPECLNQGMSVDEGFRIRAELLLF